MDKAKPRLAIITEFSVQYYAGGGERRYYEHAKRLTTEYDVTWISMRQLGSPDEEVLDGITCVHLGPHIEKPPQRSFIDFLRFQAAVVWHLWTTKYDVVDAQPFSPLLAGWFATLFTRARFFATIYDITTPGDDQFLQHGRIAFWVEKLLYRLPFRRIITISDSVGEDLVQYYGVDKKKIRLVYCGVTLEELDRIREQKKIRELISVGRLVPHKHVEDFLQVCKDLGVKGAIIGQGPLETKIKRRIRTMKLQKQVTFLGKLESYADVLKEVKRSKVLVLPSTREGFGLVLVEAGACRLPVVAYTCNGVVDVVRDGETGFLVPKRDVAALSARIKKILASGSLRKKMGLAGRKRVEKKFTWDVTTKELSQVYKE